MCCLVLCTMGMVATDGIGALSALQGLAYVHAYVQEDPGLDTMDDDTLVLMWQAVSDWAQLSTQLEPEQQLIAYRMIADIVQWLETSRAERLDHINTAPLTVMPEEYGIRDLYLRSLLVNNLVVTGSIVLPASIGTGITSLNGLTDAVQVFANGFDGTQPAFDSVGNTHTLNIPLASTDGVLAGLITSTDYYNFQNTYTTVGAATPLDVPDTIVMRDDTGSFVSTTITLTGCLVVQDDLLNNAGTLCGSEFAVTIAPQGARALQASADGNPRGMNSVDLQIHTNATAVASGAYSVIGGGLANTASGYNTVVGGGYLNVAAQIGAVVVGGGNDGTNPVVGNQALGAATFVGGGIGNTAINAYDTVVSGSGNIANSGFSFVGGGQNNVAGGPYIVVVGGANNSVGSPTGNGADKSVIVGGESNTIQPYTAHSFIGGGRGNIIESTQYFSEGYSTLVGGTGNTIVSGGLIGFIGGGESNTISGSHSVICGGYGNTVSGYSSVIVGGGDDNSSQVGNTIQSHAGFIGSGLNNLIKNSSNYCAIVSGSSNTIGANSPYSCIGGGKSNAVGDNAPFATVGGGYGNAATGYSAAAIGGGYDGFSYAGNQAQGNASFVAGGMNNLISNAGFSTSTAYSAILSGSSNTINTGVASIIAGGIGNAINGNNTFVAGTFASARNNSFVWSDGSSATAASVDNTFTARAANGYTFYTSAGSTGATLASGASSWTAISDKTRKTNFAAVDHIDILQKVAHMPIETWSYQSQDSSIRHMGPYAQDFHEAFGLGEDPLGINTVDADGVALAAIKGMYALHLQEIAELRQEIAELKKQMTYSTNVSA